MPKTKLTITGCMGRMGQQLIKTSNADDKVKIISLTENKEVKKKINGIRPEINSIKAFS